MRPAPLAGLRLCALLTAVVVTAALALAGCSGSDSAGTASRASASAPPARPLSILLTNDDGYDAQGISVLYKALVARGHRVTVVGPAVNQSGASMSTTPGPLRVTQPDPDVPRYAVTGTPVDAVTVGLTGILTAPPDLVVSGTNLGANVAYNVNYSGTVGAATAAAERGIPAVAVSADNGDGTQADFDAAAEVVTRLVDDLAVGDRLDRLAGDGLLNVNVPVASSDGPKGVRYADVGAASPWDVRYRDNGDGTYAEQRAYSARVGGAKDDARRVADGWVAISWLTPERGEHSPADLERLLGDFDPFR